MTRIATRKTHLQFEVDTMVRGRTLVVIPSAYTVHIREKGKRKGYEASWEAIYWLGAKIAADNAKRERKNRTASA
jgi:hypothetical protein